MVAPNEIPPPLSERDSALLAGLLEADCSLPALAARTSTPLGDLLDWAETPAVSARIATAERLANLRSSLTAPSSRIRAIAALEALLADKSNPIETRRNATAILRALNQSLRAVNPDREAPGAPWRGGARQGRTSVPQVYATPAPSLSARVSRTDPPQNDSGEQHLPVCTSAPLDAPTPSPFSGPPGPLIQSLTRDPLLSALSPWNRATFPLPPSPFFPDHPGPISALRAAAGIPAQRPP